MEIYIVVSLIAFASFTLGYVFNAVHNKMDLSYDINVIKEDVGNLNVRIERLLSKN